MSNVTTSAPATTPIIPATIMQQIGNRAFMMLGASHHRYMASEPNWLSFRIKGSRKINYIKVTLDEGKDLYKMEFGKIGKDDYKVVKTFEDVYCDMLHKLIEETTGLYTSL